MALRSEYSDMYGMTSLPRLKKTKSSVTPKKVRKPKVKMMKSLFGKRRGKKKPIY